MAGSDLITETQIQAALTTIATDVKAIATGGTGWYDLSVFTRANIAADDMLLLGDVSDTTINASGSMRKISVPGLAEVQRRLLTNFNATDDTNGFAADRYLSGSEVVMPDTPVVGSKYRALVRITKTNVGTATPIFTLRIGSAGSTADTARGTLTFGAGTTAVDAVLVEILATFVSINSSTGAIELNARATTNLTTTGWSNAIKAPTGASGSFNNTALGTNKIGLSYNGGTAAVHTVTYVEAEYIP